jgi:sialate O-acetylesterase
MPVPIWGTAAPGETVTVRFRDQTKTAQAGKEGQWSIRLDALQAGGPDKLTIAGSNTLTYDDVLVGEVWLGSGQSNMAQSASGYFKSDAVLEKRAAGTYPKVRLLQGAGGWHEATPANNQRFSALLLSFGIPLQKELDVPVGLMVGAVGGTPSSLWLTQEAFQADAAVQKLVGKLEAINSQGFGSLYEKHIRPLIPHAIRGVLWDQGEAGTKVDGVDQYTLMGALMRGWRKDWGQGDFPFLCVQKPSGGGTAWDAGDPAQGKSNAFGKLPPAVPNAADARFESHLRIATHPNAAVVHCGDLGGGTHPAIKSDYGNRAARVALGFVYGKPIEYYGPTYQSHQIDGDRVRVEFAHVGKGLAMRHGDELQGFALAGADRTFHWASAVVLTSPEVRTPVAVRYAWSPSRAWANLFNLDTLPAVPFRTDDWTGRQAAPAKKAPQ